MEYLILIGIITGEIKVEADKKDPMASVYRFSIDTYPYNFSQKKYENKYYTVWASTKKISHKLLLLLKRGMPICIKADGFSDHVYTTATGETKVGRFVAPESMSLVPRGFGEQENPINDCFSDHNNSAPADLF